MYTEKTDPSQSHERLARDIERSLHVVIKSLEIAFPQYNETWRNIDDLWTGRVLSGSNSGVVYENNIIYISDDVSSPYAFTKSLCLLISKNTPGFCQNELISALEHCRTNRIEIDMSCDDILAFGLASTPFFDAFYCDSTRNRGRIHEYDELMGHGVNETMKILHKNYPKRKIVPEKWDIIEGDRSTGDHFNVTYDPISGKTVYPQPRLNSMEIPYDFRNRCFITADNGQCIQTPIDTTELRQKFIGRPYASVFNTLRFQFPHTAIEIVYDKARIDRDKRTDRILILVGDDMTVKNIIV